MKALALKGYATREFTNIGLKISLRVSVGCHSQKAPEREKGGGGSRESGRDREMGGEDKREKITI